MTFLDANSGVNFDTVSFKSYTENNKPVNIAQVLILNLYLKLKLFCFRKIHRVFIFIIADYYKRKVKPVLLHFSLFTNYR